MRVRFELGGFLVGLAAVCAIAACGGVSDEESGSGRALLIVDRDAREAGVEVRLPAGMLSSSTAGLTVDGLPVPLEAPLRVELIRPGGDTAVIDVRAEEVVHVRGADGRADVMALGEAIDPDRVVLHTDEDAVIAIARELDAEVERAPDGAFIVVAPEALVRIAGADVRGRIGAELLRVSEAFPVENVTVHDGGPRGSLGELLPEPAFELPGNPPAHDVTLAPDPAPTSPPALEPVQAPAPAIAPAPTAAPDPFEPTASFTPRAGAVLAATATPAVSLGLTPRDPAAAPPHVIGEGIACADPVAGTWIGLIHDPRYSDWYEFTLEIQHAPGAAGEAGELVGTIRSRSWSGDSQVSEAPAVCSPWGGSLFHWTVGMQARGQYAGGKLRFGGIDWRVTETPCGRAPGPGMYNLDVFSGWITEDGAYFDSTNTDGGRMDRFRTPFRRVGCGR